MFVFTVLAIHKEASADTSLTLPSTVVSKVGHWEQSVGRCEQNIVPFPVKHSPHGITHKAFPPTLEVVGNNSFVIKMITMESVALDYTLQCHTKGDAILTDIRACFWSLWLILQTAYYGEYANTLKPLQAFL